MNLGKKHSIFLALVIFTTTLLAQPREDGYQLVEVAGMHETHNYQFVENQQLYTDVN